MTIKLSAAAAVFVAAVFGSAGAASAQTNHHGSPRQVASSGGVRYASTPRQGGYQALVSDGPGSGFGFHHNPAPFRVGAAIARDRQRDAVRSAVAADAIGSQPYGYGFYGDSVYGQGTNAAYGVFNGSDGYGSPYFAGYYGPGDGADYGVLGHAYSN